MASTVAIGVPLYFVAYGAFVEAWMEMDLPSPSVVPRKTIRGVALDDAHNQLVKWFLEKTDRDYLLLLEHDHTFPPNLVQRVASYGEHDDAAVVGALYYLHTEPYMPCCFVPNPGVTRDGRPDPSLNRWDDPKVWDGSDWSDHKVVALWPSLEEEFIRGPGLQRVSSVGMGCTAIRRDVLEQWPEGQPYFQPRHRDGSPTTDDVRFCQEVQSQGHGVYLDSGLVLGHLSVVEVTRDTYRGNLRKLASKHRIPVPR